MNRPIGGRRADSWFLDNHGDHIVHAEQTQQATGRQSLWNKGRLVVPKPPFDLKEIWTIGVRLQIAERMRDLAMFNLAIDRELCELIS